jgi:hypothetical protein
MDAAHKECISDQLKRLVTHYGSPLAAEKATGLPAKYFFRLKCTRRHRDTVAPSYKHTLQCSIAELDGVFEIKLSQESKEKAEALANVQNISLREVVESIVEGYFRT